MPSTVFTNHQTVVYAEWLNAINNAVYMAIGTGGATPIAPSTPAEVVANLGLGQIAAGIFPSLTVTGDTHLQGNLTVDGTSNLHNTVVTGNETISGTLGVTGVTTLSTVNATTETVGTLTVNTTATLPAATTVGGSTVANQSYVNTQIANNNATNNAAVLSAAASDAQTRANTAQANAISSANAYTNSAIAGVQPIPSGNLVTQTISGSSGSVDLSTLGISSGLVAVNLKFSSGNGGLQILNGATVLASGTAVTFLNAILYNTGTTYLLLGVATDTISGGSGGGGL